MSTDGCITCLVVLSQVAHIGTAGLSLKLAFDRGSGQREGVVMELSLKQFYEMMGELEKAKLYVDALSQKGESVE